MVYRERRTTWLAGLLWAGALLLSLPGVAVAGEETGWRLRFYAASVDFEEGSDPRSTANYDQGVGGGIGLNAEYRFSRRLGVDLGLLAAGGFNVETRVDLPTGRTTVATDTLAFRPLTAGLNIHLTPDARVDLYVAPLMAWISYGSFSVWTGHGSATTLVDFDDDLAPGAALGLVVPFGNERRWSFVTNLTYLDSSLDGRGASGQRLSSDYDSTIFGLGFGYRL